MLQLGGAFLDFAKAYDRVDRGWLQQCMQRLGFPATCIRWAQLLLEGTQARITFNNGQLSRVINVQAGCAQGSPLSPLLYVIAAQPLAARCRQVQQQPGFASISLPSGEPAPCCHQHADDTSLHAATVQGIRQLLDQAVQPFCAASAAQLNISKSTGMSVGNHPLLVGPEPVTGVPFVDSANQPVRHLGVLLASQGAHVHAGQLFQQRLQTIAWRIKVWSKQRLDLTGRLLVAKQVLASCLGYHAQFVQPPDNIMRRINRLIHGYLLGRGLVDDGDNRPLRGCPARAVAALPKDKGGIAQVDVQAHCLALQGKVAAMLLHPSRACWKQFMIAALDRAMPGTGVLALLQASSRGVQAATRAGRLHSRHAGYIAAFTQVGLQRHAAHASMTPQQVLLEPLVGNHSVGNAADGKLFLCEAALPQQLTVGPQQPRPTQLQHVAGQLQLQPSAGWPLSAAAMAHTAHCPSC